MGSSKAYFKMQLIFSLWNCVLNHSFTYKWILPTQKVELVDDNMSHLGKSLKKVLE
jgi:hypothetical protein